MPGMSEELGVAGEPREKEVALGLSSKLKGASKRDLAKGNWHTNEGTATVRSS